MQISLAYHDFVLTFIYLHEAYAHCLHHNLAGTTQS